MCIPGAKTALLFMPSVFGGCLAQLQATFTEPQSWRGLTSISVGSYCDCTFILSCSLTKNLVPSCRYGPYHKESTLRAEASFNLNSDKETRRHAKYRVSLGSQRDRPMSACLSGGGVDRVKLLRTRSKIEQPAELNNYKTISREKALTSAPAARRPSPLARPT